MSKRSPIMLCLAAAGTLSGYHCAAQSANNILVIVMDDIGKEMLSIYDTPVAVKANTPNIDRLAQRGVVFDNVWGSPLSAPVRAAMLTGRYGHHTGIVALDITLPTKERTLFEALPKEYTNAVIGKWHLSKDLDFAADYGIDHFAGIATGGGVRDYYRWRFTENGRSVLSGEYVTTQITNSAKEWIADQSTPWICWVAYNAPHTPLHLPPGHMHTQKKLSGKEEDIAKNPLPYYLAMIESLDYDIGRLLEGVDEQTLVILVGDNGTERTLLQPPYSPRHGKGTLYESGVAIPMVVCGGGVTTAGVRSGAMVSAVDIFPSVMEFAGVEMPRYEDGYSFAAAAVGGESLRQYNFSEIMNRRMGYMNAVSDGRYKLITRQSGSSELYDTAQDPLESQNLLEGRLSTEQRNAYDSLEAEIKRMRIPLVSLPTAMPQAERGAGMHNRGGDNSGNQYRSRR